MMQYLIGTKRIKENECLYKILMESFKGPFTPSVRVNAVTNSAMMLAVLFQLKTMELFENGLQPHSGVTPLFSLRIVSLVSS